MLSNYSRKTVLIKFGGTYEIKTILTADAKIEPNNSFNKKDLTKKHFIQTYFHLKIMHFNCDKSEEILPLCFVLHLPFF